MTRYLISVLITTCLMPSLLFVARYARTTWRSTLVGRAVMLLHGVILAVLTLALIGSLWPDMPGRTLLRIATYAAITGALWVKYLALVRVQRQGKTARRGGPPQ